MAILLLMIDQCNYTANNLKDSIYKDRIVIGISDETTRARLLQNSRTDPTVMYRHIPDI